MKINILLSKLLSYFPSVHFAAKQFYTKRLLSRPAGLHPSGFRLSGPVAMQDGSFEPDESKQISDLLKEADVFVNVGANIGYYVCIARNIGKPVIAVEPLDRNVQFLKKNLELNNWMDVEVVPVGLGEREGLGKIYGGGTAASLVRGWAGASQKSYDLIPVSTLDNVLSDRFAGKKLLILIDVEGFEFNVVQGALRQLKRCPAPIWFIEICIDEHQPDGTSINPDLKKVFSLFWSNGYTAYKAGCESGLVSWNEVEAWALGNNLPATHNFVFKML